MKLKKKNKVVKVEVKPKFEKVRLETEALFTSDKAEVSRLEGEGYVVIATQSEIKGGIRPKTWFLRKEI